MRKRSVDEQRAIIPDDAVYAAFLRRPDIAALPPDEQQRRWAEHLPRLNQFRRAIAQVESVHVTRDG